MTAVDSLARHRRWLNRRSASAPRRPAGRACCARPPPDRSGTVAWPLPDRSSTSQSPSGIAVEKCTVSGRAAGRSATAAGSVAELFTTTRSPGSSRSGSSAKAWWLISPAAVLLRPSAQRRPWPRRVASGGSCASSSAGRSNDSSRRPRRPAAAVIDASPCPRKPRASAPRPGTGRWAAARRSAAGTPE